MQESKANIIAELQKKILPLQGIRPAAPSNFQQIEMGIMQSAFPQACFPLGAVHEFLTMDIEQVAASSGFIAALLSAIMKKGGITVWISSARTLFPPALTRFNIEPDHVIFIDLQKEKDILWVMEETLKCNGLSAVVAEMQEISFTASRRLQLAVEQTGVTGFILHHRPRNKNTVACVSRWKISSLSSETGDDIPGVGFPRWNVELLKIRNGKPGSWQVEWSEGKFRHISPSFIHEEPGEKRKTG